MWKRFKRAMRSFFGFFVSSIEDPELILEQNIRDLNDQVPQMNESIAMVRANLTLLEKENPKYTTEVGDLTAKVKAAIQAGRDDLAAQYATRLQMEKSALARNEPAARDRARPAYDKALNVKKAFMREKDKKTAGGDGRHSRRAPRQVAGQGRRRDGVLRGRRHRRHPRRDDAQGAKSRPRSTRRACRWRSSRSTTRRCRSRKTPRSSRPRSW